MGKYILKRVVLAVVTIFIITLLLFIFVRIMPGNPFPSERMNAAQIAAKRAEMGLDDPMFVQFFNYLKNFAYQTYPRVTS